MTWFRRLPLKCICLIFLCPLCSHYPMNSFQLWWFFKIFMKIMEKRMLTFSFIFFIFLLLILSVSMCLIEITYFSILEAFVLLASNKNFKSYLGWLKSKLKINQSSPNFSLNSGKVGLKFGVSSFQLCVGYPSASIFIQNRPFHLNSENLKSPRK